MQQTFQFQQGQDGKLQYARLAVPGTGRQEKDTAPILLINIEDGEITLEVYGDIKSSEPTHIIPLDGAKLTARPVKECEDIVAAGKEGAENG